MAKPANNTIQIKKPKKTPLMGPKGTRKPDFSRTFRGKKDERPGPVNMFETSPNWFSQLQPRKLYQGWKKATVNPVGSAVASGLLAAGGTYLAAPWIARKLIGLRNAMPGLSPVEMDQSEENIKRMRNRMAIIAAIVAGGSSVATHFDPKYPWKSMLKWDYMKKDAALNSNAQVMSMDLIPLNHAKEIVANDGFLTSGQKAAIGTIFNKTPDQEGNTSMADLTAGAIRAGLGFAGGAVAGYALGKIFALPPAVTRAASLSGGLANALKTSGLIT